MCTDLHCTPIKYRIQLELPFQDSSFNVLKSFEISSKHKLFLGRLVAKSPILRSLLNIPQLLFVIQMIHPLKLIAS